MKSLLEQKVRFAFGLVVFTMLLMGALSYRFMIVSDESGQWMRHTHDVLDTIEDLKLAMETIESASRGFALTGKESDLAEFGSSVVLARQDEAAIRALTEDNPAEQIHFPLIGTLIADRIQHAESVIDLRRNGGVTAAASAIGTVRDEQVKDRFQAIASSMQQEELRLLSLRREKNSLARGLTRWVLFLGSLLGVVVVVIAARSVLLESAKRKASEGALQNSEENHQMLMDGIQDCAIFMMDPRGQVISWNAGAEKVKGYKAEEIVGQNFACFFSPADIARQKPEGVLRIAAATGRFQEFGMRVRKDGSEFMASVTNSVLRDPDGSLRGFCVVSHDLTAIHESEAKYRGLLEAAPDGMVVVNEAGEIVLLNARAEKQFGYRRNELLGRKVKEIIPEGFAERLIADAQRTVAEASGQQIGSGIELHGRRKDGEQFPIEIMLSPLQCAEGVLVTAAIRDISARKLLERQWRQSQKMEAIGQLTGGIAHDFNNLLAIVIGNLGLMERMIAGNEPAMKRLLPAQKAAARGADLTRRLLALASKEDLNPANLRLEDSIQEMIELASRALGPEIRIVTKFDKSVPAVYVDATGLGSALLNLAVNARDAMPKGGTLTIGTNLIDLDYSFPGVTTGELKSGSYARISVSDTGHGMSKETLERALEPFFTTKGRNKGTGLGLAMVYGFARQSGGTVRLFSELGRGTTVSLYLPLAATPPTTVREAPEAHFSVHTGGTVLVVEDELELREIANTYLTEMGYSVLRADNAASALNTLALFKEIDLMLTDIIMPGGMNGVELAEKARELNPRLRVIYSSGYPSDALVERDGTMVDGPMLRKPYQRSEFAAIIQRTMEGPATQWSRRGPKSETGIYPSKKGIYGEEDKIAAEQR